MEETVGLRSPMEYEVVLSPQETDRIIELNIPAGTKLCYSLIPPSDETQIKGTKMAGESEAGFNYEFKRVVPDDFSGGSEGFRPESSPASIELAYNKYGNRIISSGCLIPATGEPEEGESIMGQNDYIKSIDSRLQNVEKNVISINDKIGDTETSLVEQMGGFKTDVINSLGNFKSDIKTEVGEIKGQIKGFRWAVSIISGLIAIAGGVIAIIQYLNYINS